MSSVDELRSLASDITVGFEALLNRLGQLRKVEDDLRRQLERAVDRVSTTSLCLCTLPRDVTISLALEPSRNFATWRISFDV